MNETDLGELTVTELESDNTTNCFHILVVAAFVDFIRLSFLSTQPPKIFVIMATVKRDRYLGLDKGITTYHTSILAFRFQ